MAKSFSFSELKPTGLPEGRALTRADHAFASMVRDLATAKRPDWWSSNLRPSAAPICEWLALLGHFHKDHRLKLPAEEKSFARDYAMRVGVAIHEVLQDWLGRLGYLYGAFECGRESCRWRQRHQGTPARCEKCGYDERFTYVEFDMKDQDPSDEISGAKVDGLIRFDWMEPETYYIVDFKSCSSEKVPTPEYGFKDPNHLKYLYQTAIYQHLLERANVNIVGTAFMMVPRDDPAKSQVILVDQTETNGPIYKEFVASWKRTRQAARDGDARALKRACETRRDSPDCPFNALCWDRDAQVGLFKEHGLLAQFPEW